MNIDLADSQNNWISAVKKSFVQKQGFFNLNDEFGHPLLLEWSTSDILSPLLATFKQDISEFASEIISDEELLFLKTYPEKASQEVFLMSCRDLLAEGADNINWEEAKQKIKSTIKQFYLMDLTKFDPSLIKPLMEDVYIFASLTDIKSEELVGFYIASITPALKQGEVKLITMAVAPVHKEKGHEKILVNSILSMVPSLKRLFVSIRPTNTNTQKVLESIGFKLDINPVVDPSHPVSEGSYVVWEYRN